MRENAKIHCEGGVWFFEGEGYKYMISTLSGEIENSVHWKRPLDPSDLGMFVVRSALDSKDRRWDNIWMSIRYGRRC